jgi:DNA (cytosine-5)-methyltransferase 1
MSNQYSIFDDCFVDSFAGGGGASTGIEMATGHPVDVAINHNEAAIMMHQRNHPFTEHYIEDIWQVDPKTAVRGRHVKLAWFSPDCKHFSRAKGAALVDKKIRGLAWVVLKWAAMVRPDVIMLENVPEFTTWGPVRKGKPVKSKSGKTYQKWLSQLEALGYKVETRKLCAADYGAPTIRTRFHLIARCDGKPIVFPERTHAPRDSIEVKSGKLKPWRSAAEVIDFSLPCPSIFASKKEIKDRYGVNAMRPIKENTLRRIARGLDKFVIKSAEPFIVPVGYGENKGQKPRVHDMKEPLSTVVSSTKQYVCDPLMTPYVICNNAGNAPHSMDDPVPTVTTGGRNILAAPTLIQYHTEQSEKEVRGQTIDDPIQTVDAANRYGLSSVFLSEYYGNARDGIGIREPMQTITSKDRESINAAWLTQYFSGEGHYHSTEEPLATITTMEREGVTLAHLAHFKGKDKGQSCHDPLMTVTARDGQFADVRTTIVKWDGQTDLGYWNEVRKMLNQYCGYNLADDEILLLNIRGIWYFISDIGLRMLTPRELYDAMGFPHDYIIDKDINGNPITRADQVARCGNAVCPAVAEALVRANLPEYCKKKISDMAQLHNVMTS